MLRLNYLTFWSLDNPSDATQAYMAPYYTGKATVLQAELLLAWLEAGGKDTTKFKRAVTKVTQAIAALPILLEEFPNFLRKRVAPKPK